MNSNHNGQYIKQRAAQSIRRLRKSGIEVKYSYDSSGSLDII